MHISRVKSFRVSVSILTVWKFFNKPEKMSAPSANTICGHPCSYRASRVQCKICVIFLTMFDAKLTIYDLRRSQRRSQEFDLGGYKWVKETKQPHKKFKVD